MHLYSSGPKILAKPINTMVREDIVAVRKETRAATLSNR
jgi:hypothetical protein